MGPFRRQSPWNVPAGTDGATNDITAYENVVAMIETDGKDGQVSVGTLVKVGDVWRVIDAPTILDPTNKMAEVDGFFFQTATRPTETGTAENNPTARRKKCRR